jgi:hypothetical protein
LDSGNWISTASSLMVIIWPTLTGSGPNMAIGLRWHVRRLNCRRSVFDSLDFMFFTSFNQSLLWLLVQHPNIPKI